MINLLDVVIALMNPGFIVYSGNLSAHPFQQAGIKHMIQDDVFKGLSTIPRSVQSRGVLRKPELIAQNIGNACRMYARHSGHFRCINGLNGDSTIIPFLTGCCVKWMSNQAWGLYVTSKHN